MPRLRNNATGVVVRVSDETAERLDAEWVPFESVPHPAPVVVEEPEPVKRTRKPRS